jgi:hypothetical protein
MATRRPFIYNTGATVTGTEKLSNITSGTPTSGFSASGLTGWRSGPDEDLGYVIAYTTTGPRTAGGGIENISGTSIGYKRSVSKTDESFLSLANNIGATTFANTSAAKTWLNANGYWTSFLPYSAGLYKTTYSGYFSDNPNFFGTATPQAFGTNPSTSVQTTSITEASSDDGSNFSCQWIGYFKPTTTETYTFFTSSDDASYVWVGATAISGFSSTNAVVNNGGLHGNQEQSGSIALTAGVYYPIRIQFGENGGGDVMTFNYSTPTITKTTNVTGLVFYNPSTNGF